MIGTSCPAADRWQAHLKGELPADEQAQLTAHLDACPACQQTVESLAVAADSLLAVARRVGQEAATHETALEGAIRAAQAHTEAEPVPPTSNDFAYLDPPSGPGQLGRLAHYAVLEVVGRGGMGIVFKALDERLQRIVAIKVLSPAYATNELARQRFQREAKAAAAVSHDHVVPIYHVDEANGVVYLVMPLIVGKSLEERIEQTGPLPLEELLRIGMQIAAGLAAAHKQGLVHRDIKPANILLENGVERVKITDFGLARAVDDAHLTQSGVIAGTPLYMSPEQARGEDGIDARSDLFSLGSVLYAMATGRPPFRATGSMAVLKRVCDETPRPLRQLNPDVPVWLEAIVAKLHAKWPGDRFQSAQEVADLLGQHLAHLQQPRRVPRPAPVVGPTRPPGRPSGTLSAVGIAAVILVALLVLSMPVGVVVLMYLGMNMPVNQPGAPVAEMHAEARGEPMEAMAPEPAPNQMPRFLPGWGEIVDPTEAYRITDEQGLWSRLTIAAPRGDHEDDLVRPNFKAPRVLMDVQGDFSVTVKVLPFNVNDGDAVAAGLLVWHDAKNFVRYQIAHGRKWGPGPNQFTRVEVEGNTKLDQFRELRDDQRYLQLDRQGNTVHISWGADGKAWDGIFRLPPVNLPAGVKVGVVVTTAVKDAAPSVTFEDFHFGPVPGPGKLRKPD